MNVMSLDVLLKLLTAFVHDRNRVCQHEPVSLIEIGFVFPIVKFVCKKPLLTSRSVQFNNILLLFCFHNSKI